MNEQLLNKIIHGDCLEEMKKIEDKSIDMILCDLPYGTTQNKWDSIIPLDKLWEQYNRIIKDNGVITLTAQSPFDKILGASNIKDYRYEWIWSKNIATGHLNVKRQPMRKHENVLIFYKKKPTYNPQMTVGEPYTNIRKGVSEEGKNYNPMKVRTDTINKGERYPVSILEFNREIGLHPTQKPVDLGRYLIRTYTNESETILDNTCGSGSFLVAALLENRNFIGIEQEWEYCEIANQRIEEVKLNKELK